MGRVHFSWSRAHSVSVPYVEGQHRSRLSQSIAAVMLSGHSTLLIRVAVPANGTRSVRTGARVGVAEMPFGAIASDSVGGAGGTCVLRGCVPKKLFVYAASYPEEFNAARGFGCAVCKAYWCLM